MPPETQVAKPAAADSVEALVNEFNEGTKATVPADTVAKLTKAVTPLAQWAEGEIAARLEQKTTEDVKDLVTFIKKTDGLPNLPDRFVRGFAREYGAEHPEFFTAFDSRGANPDAWKEQSIKVRDALIEDAKQLPGNQVRTDIEAALASVRNSSTNPPPANDFDPAEAMTWSDEKWELFEKQAARAARR